MDGKGWILVFDLDECIATFKSWKNIFNGKEFPVLNPYIVDILKAGVEKKEKTVEAIFLLTNNSSEEYISLIHTRLKQEIGVIGNIFDLIWSRYNPQRLVYNRNHSIQDPSKSLEDVRGMLITLNKTTDNSLKKRILFFDDQDRHELAEDLVPYDNFIHTVPFYKQRQFTEPSYYRKVLNKLQGLPATPTPQQGGSFRQDAFRENLRGGRRKKTLKQRIKRIKTRSVPKL